MTEATAVFQTIQFSLIPPLSFLCRLAHAPTLNDNGKVLILSSIDGTISQELRSAQSKFKDVIVLSRRRSKNAITAD